MGGYDLGHACITDCDKDVIRSYFPSQHLQVSCFGRLVPQSEFLTSYLYSELGLTECQITRGPPNCFFPPPFCSYEVCPLNAFFIYFFFFTKVVHLKRHTFDPSFTHC